MAKRITINGKTYPMRLVMGAMLLFKRETGKDVREMDQGNMEEMLRLMWCCIKCASQAEGVDFPYDFETFCNSTEPSDVEDWNRQMAAPGDKKKAPVRTEVKK